MERFTKKFALGLVLASLFAFSNVQAAPVTYNFEILGDVQVGDETFGFNAWDLTAGDVISATGQFTADLGATLTGTATFDATSGNSFVLDLLSATLNETDDSLYGAVTGASISFVNGELTEFNFIYSDGLGSDFNSNFSFFDDGFASTVIGEWRADATLTAVPVPAAVWLFATGLGALGFARRKARV